MTSDTARLCEVLGSWSINVWFGSVYERGHCIIFWLPRRACILGVSRLELCCSSSSGLGNLMGDLTFLGRLGISTAFVDFISGPVGVAGVPMGAIGFVICRLAFAWRRSLYCVVYG